MGETMRGKRIGIIVIVLLLVGGGAYGFSQLHQQGTRTTHQRTAQSASSTTSSATTRSSAGTRRAQAVQTVLNHYRGTKNIGVAYVDLTSGASASLHGKTTFYAASVAKLPVVAYVQQAIMMRQLTWTTTFPYADAANQVPNAMVSGGTGTLQNENHQGKTYAVADLLQRTVEQSDNQASNQLLYHVALQNKTAFTQYLHQHMGMSNYSKQMSALQANRAIMTVWQQNQKASNWLQNTDWAHDKIGTLPVKVAHKIGINGAANNDAAIVLGKHQFALTIMTDGWTDAQIATLATQVYEATEK